jgi:tRNA A37 threonylcarbamoyladenosine dehydratase
MRRELKERGVKKLRVVYSPEPATPPHPDAPALSQTGSRMPTGSLPFVPGVAGLLLAGEVIRDLCET